MRYSVGEFAIDGSLACANKAYLVVQQADSKLNFLKSVWTNIKAQMEMIFSQADEDSGIRGRQQNTYNTAIQGAKTFIDSDWVTALRSSEAMMASLVGDTQFAENCLSFASKATTSYDSICWREDFG